jgi:hypothetical protein
MPTDRTKLYLRVGNARHLFKVPPGISLGVLVERYRDTLGLTNVPLGDMRASVVIPLDEPLAEFGLRDDLEIIIEPGAIADDAEYVGPA